MPDRSQAISRLINSRQSRESYIRSKLNTLIPSQIRGLRLKHPMTQSELAVSADMKQSRISAMERPGQVKFNLETLIRLAAAMKVGLKVAFVPFSEMLDWENSFSRDQFDPTRIDQDRRFLNPGHLAYQQVTQEEPLLRNYMAKRTDVNTTGLAHYIFPMEISRASRVSQDAEAALWNSGIVLPINSATGAPLYARAK